MEMEPSKPISIIDLINAYVASTSPDKPSETSVIMNTLLANQLEMLKKMDENVKNIMKDGKLDAGDIPEIILLMKNTSNLYSPELKKIKVSRGDMIIFIREVLLLIVSNEHIEIKNKDLSVKLIHSGTTLLSSTIELEETVNMKKWFRCCF